MPVSFIGVICIDSQNMFVINTKQKPISITMSKLNNQKKVINIEKCQSTQQSNIKNMLKISNVRR